MRDSVMSGYRTRVGKFVKIDHLASSITTSHTNDTTRILRTFPERTPYVHNLPYLLYGL